MSIADISFSNKERRTIIFAVTFGNLLEWYEIYLYIYWAPIISKLFFNSASDLVNMTNMFLVFAVGFLARPLGGVFFGRLGDRVGRRKALLLSIMMMTVPTFITGVLPTYEKIGILAPITLAIMRILQSFPAGGELPGASCYLYESARSQTQKYLCSWGAYGLQTGILLSTIECFILEKTLSTESLINWGWRFSFFAGGVIGLLGLYLRYKLHETPVYQEMVTHEKVVKQSLGDVLVKHKKGIFMAILFCALNSSAFYFLTVNFPVYLGEMLGISYTNNLLITAALLIFVTVPLPFLGRLADKTDYRKLLIYSTWGLILLLFPFYFSIKYSSLAMLALTIFPYCLLFTMLSALVPFLLSDQFPTRVRFTCVGVSFNLADAIIGGFTPVISLYLTSITGNRAAFCGYILFCSILSLSSYYWIVLRKESTAKH